MIANYYWCKKCERVTSEPVTDAPKCGKCGKPMEKEFGE